MGLAGLWEAQLWERSNGIWSPAAIHASVSCLAAVFNADPSQLFPADVFWWMAVPLVGTVNTQMFQAARAAC